MKYLSYYFLPQRLVQIRDLRIHWQLDNLPIPLNRRLFPADLDDWFRSWDAIRKMTGLKRLHVNMEYAFHGWEDFAEARWEESGKEMLTAVKEITAPGDFVVYLPDSKCSTDVDPGNSRCVFKVPEEDEEPMRIRL